MTADESMFALCPCGHRAGLHRLSRLELKDTCLAVQPNGEPCPCRNTQRQVMKRGRINAG